MLKKALAFAIPLCVLAMTAGPAEARGPAAGFRGQAVVGHHHHHGHWRGGLWLGIGLGAGYWGPYGGAWYPYPYPYLYPGDVIVERAPVPYEPSPAARAPDPVFTPRNGQDARQTEYDRQDCNRWAMSQPAAVADAKVFHQTALACMESRGYTVR